MIDYSAPNVAKEMHVGHLRSTVIGDALARVLGFLGHEVLRENHIGDWGTPFGMLIEHLVDLGGSAEAESFSVRDLNEFYAQARVQFDSDPDFAERCRRRVVLLQSGDPETLRLWRIFVAESLRHNDEVYRCWACCSPTTTWWGRASTTRSCRWWSRSWRPKGLLVEHEGALCVFPEGFENRHGDPLPLIVRKSDGGYGYPATDLACITRPHRPPGRHHACSTWSAPSKRCTSGWSSPWPRWPATCPTPRPPSTWGSGWCSVPTARRWPAARAARSG